MSFTDFLSSSEKYTKRYEESTSSATSGPAAVKHYIDPPFYVNKLQHRLPAETQRWIRNSADERAAVEYGCRFSEARGQYTVNWLEQNCLLYEGDKAGDPISVEDWQHEMFMQGFGWLWFDAEWEQRRVGAGWLRRFTVISGWIPKKNAKSPTLAATGIYLFAGDGEAGQKCFSLATTRDQALISHTHALNFVRQSPSLMARCKIDATTGTISDRYTNSSYSILCGDKGGLKKSKEGINGSLLIDETHVVDQGIMNVVGRAGISRRQPLKAQLSTSGQDTGGYGFEQYELGNDNLKAAEESRPFDFRFYHFEYSIPQKTSIDDLRNPDKIDNLIRISNPTIGRIVRFNEAKQDWQKSLRSDTELVQFAMYRLNQWNTGGGAFIAGSDWDRCVKPFKFADIQEHPCVIGVDMSRVRDMTAVVLVFAVPRTIMVPINRWDLSEGVEEREINIPYVFPYFWIPKRSIGQYEAKLNISALAQSKQLYITDSPIVKAEVIAEHINYLDERFNCHGVASDMAYSRALSASLGGTHGWDVENRLFLIPQTAANIGPAVDQLQGCILAQEMVHNNNSVMNWQLGNIQIVEDKNNNRRFAKPPSQDYRKIDGWAALLNAFYLMMNDPEIYPGATFSISLSR